MKLTEPNIKIKVNESNLKSLTSYLYEIILNSDKYLQPWEVPKIFKKIVLHNIKEIYQKACKIQFKNFALEIYGSKYKGVLNITDAERHSLIVISSLYPLPLDINFIEYELKNQLLR